MQTAIEHIKKELKDIYSESEIRTISNAIISKITGMSYTEIILNKNTIFSEEQRNLLDSFISALKKNIPLQYILGQTEFMGLTFEVNSSVLIPRPETEELIEWILEINQEKQINSMLDIGTGSGCIAVSLAKFIQGSSVTAFDISEQAIAVATRNAKSNQVNISFQQRDILNAPFSEEKWDTIVSNPPYIPEMEKANMNKNVLDYEPHLALFVTNEDPLIFYRKIAEFALCHLETEGNLFFEIHYDQALNIKTLLESLSFKHVEIRKDMSGNDRMIRAVKV